jgi:hypothetical protein
MVGIRGILRLVGTTIGVMLAYALEAQETWVWRQQCESNEWWASCFITDESCGGNNRRYFNNWGLERCNSIPGWPTSGSIVIFPEGANALLASYATVQSIRVERGATFSWRNGWLDLRQPSDGSPGLLTNQGTLRILEGARNTFSGTVVNEGVLVHEMGGLEFRNACLRNHATAEVRSGGWSWLSTTTGEFINTGTLRKTTTSSFLISVPVLLQDARVEVQAGNLSFTAPRGFSNILRNVRWSVANGATLAFSTLAAAHTFSGVHDGQIEGTLLQSESTVSVDSAGAVFAFTGTGYQWVSGVIDGGAAGLTNAGILRLVGNERRRLSGALFNDGALIHTDGTLDFEAASLHNRAVTEVRSGQWTNFSGNNFFVNTGALHKPTAGEFVLSVPTRQRNAAVNVEAGRLVIQMNTHTHEHENVRWNIASGASLVIQYGTHTFSGLHDGQIDGAFVLPDSGTTLQAGSTGVTFAFTGAGLQWQAGWLNGSSAGVVNTGVLRMVGNRIRRLSGTLVNHGTLIHEVGTTTFDNASLHIRGSVELRSGGWTTEPNTSNIIYNMNTLRKTTAQNFSLAVPIEQRRATVQVEAGTLYLSGSNNLHEDVRWSVANGASIEFRAGTHTFVGTHEATIEGGLLQVGATVQVGSNGATFNFTGTGYRWEWGTLDGGSAGLVNNGILRIVQNGSHTLSGVLINNGTLLHDGGFVGFRSARLQNNGLVEMRGPGWYDSSNSRLVNTGTLRVRSLNPDRPIFSSIFVNTTNSGLIELQNSTLNISNLTQTAGETRIHRGATLNAGSPLALQGGRLTGAGRLQGALNNSAGVLAPGIEDPDQPTLNPLGILTIVDGNLTMGNDAVFEVELAGTDNSDPANPQYDQVVLQTGSLTRTVQLNGVLRVKARDGYTPATGDAFDILVRSGSSWNRTGAFHTVEVDPDTLPCFGFEVQYLPDRVRLVARRTIEPDVNGDDCVDDADLLAVLFAYGQTGSGIPADVNCDRIVDEADLLGVLLAFGNGC